MIQANAKCINNGKKLNETIGALNNILNVVVSEEIDIVDSNNQPSKRWFFTGKLTGQKQDSDTGDRDNLGNDKNRDKLDTGAGRPIAPGNAGVAPTGNITGGGGMLKWDGNKVVEGSGNNLGGRAGQAARDFDDTLGSRPKMSGFVVPGSQAAKDNFDDSRPLPGAPPLGGKDKSDWFSDTHKWDTDQYGNAIKADGSRVSSGGMLSGGDGTGGGFPLPGAPPLGGDTTPESTPRAPRNRTEKPSVGISTAQQETLDAGQWIPQTGGMTNLQDLRQIIDNGSASQYQKDYYDNVMQNSLPLTDGKIDLQAIRNNIEDGNATPYQKDFYNKALGIDSPAGAGAESRGDQQGISYSENGIEASVTEQGKNPAKLNRDHRKTKKPTRRKKKQTPLVEAQAAVNRIQDKLFRAKQGDKKRYDSSKNMWVYKKSGDPDSDLVNTLKSQLKSAQARVKRIQKK